METDLSGIILCQEHLCLPSCHWCRDEWIAAWARLWSGLPDVVRFPREANPKLRVLILIIIIKLGSKVGSLLTTN